MQNKFLKLISFIFLISYFFINFAKSENIKNIEFIGNERIPNETILMLTKFKVGDFLNDELLNEIYINLYDSIF